MFAILFVANIVSVGSAQASQSASSPAVVFPLSLEDILQAQCIMEESAEMITALSNRVRILSNDYTKLQRDYDKLQRKQRSNATAFFCGVVVGSVIATFLTVGVVQWTR